MCLRFLGLKGAIAYLFYGNAITRRPNDVPRGLSWQDAPGGVSHMSVWVPWCFQTSMPKLNIVGPYMTSLIGLSLCELLNVKLLLLSFRLRLRRVFPWETVRLNSTQKRGAASKRIDRKYMLGNGLIRVVDVAAYRNPFLVSGDSSFGTCDDVLRTAAE